MLYLFLAIIATFTNSVLIKLNETRGANTNIVIAGNYISAGIIGWMLTFYNGYTGVSLPTLILGLLGGFLWPGGFYLLMIGIRQYGISLTGAMCRLSLIIPVIFALFFLNERISMNMGLGLSAAFFAFYCFNPRGFMSIKGVDKRAAWFFPVLILWFGIVDLWVNLFNQFGRDNEKFLFVTLIFTSSNVLAWVYVRLKHISVDGHSLVQGLILGVPNIFSTYFMLECLKSAAFMNNSARAYTIYAIMGVTLAFVAGPLFWKERVTKLNFCGLIAAVFAITLLNG